MKRALPGAPAFLFLFLFLPGALHAADEDPQVAINAKLRDGLRNTMLQLQSAQGQVATLQATQTEDEAKIKDLTAQLAKLTKASAAAKTTADQTIAGLKEQVAAQDARNAAQVTALGKWKDGYNQLVDQARAIDAKRAALVKEKILLDRKVADQQRENEELYTLGLEILKRYEHYGLGDAIAAREPFTGLAKVKFQNYIQAHEDQLTDHKIKP